MALHEAFWKVHTLCASGVALLQFAVVAARDVPWISRMPLC